GRVVGAFVAMRWVARLLVLGSGLALLVGLMHLARLSAYMHQEALTIFKLWGASAMEMRAPAMISGALVGALGGLVAGAAWIAAGRDLSTQIRSLSPMLNSLPTPSLALAIGLMAAGVVIGIFAGALGGVAPDASQVAGARG